MSAYCSTSTHPAIVSATAIYDAPGDLEPHQQMFLQSVHRIGTEHAETLRRAIQDFGVGSQAHLATKFLADQHQHDELAAALKRYDAAHASWLEG
jgi:hypothetical protein